MSASRIGGDKMELIVDRLLRHSANKKVKDSLGNTAYSIAIKNKYYSM